MAVGYNDCNVCIWDIINCKIIKTITRKDRVAVPLQLNYFKGILEIIYYDWTIDHHLIPEIISLRKALYFLYHPQQISIVNSTF